MRSCIYTATTTVLVATYTAATTVLVATYTAATTVLVATNYANYHPLLGPSLGI